MAMTAAALSDCSGEIDSEDGFGPGISCGMGVIDPSAREPEIGDVGIGVAERCPTSLVFVRSLLMA